MKETACWSEHHSSLWKECNYSTDFPFKNLFAFVWCRVILSVEVSSQKNKQRCVSRINRHIYSSSVFARDKCTVMAFENFHFLLKAFYRKSVAGKFCDPLQHQSTFFMAKEKKNADRSQLMVSRSFTLKSIPGPHSTLTNSLYITQFVASILNLCFIIFYSLTRSLNKHSAPTCSDRTCNLRTLFRKNFSPEMLGDNRHARERFKVETLWPILYVLTCLKLFAFKQSRMIISGGRTLIEAAAFRRESNMLSWAQRTFSSCQNI